MLDLAARRRSGGCCPVGAEVEARGHRPSSEVVLVPGGVWVLCRRGCRPSLGLWLCVAAWCLAMPRALARWRLSMREAWRREGAGQL